MDMPREVIDAMRAARKTAKLERKLAGLAFARPGKAEREAARAAERERVRALNADMGKRYNCRDVMVSFPQERAPKHAPGLDLAAYKSAHRIGVKSKPRLHGGKWDYLSN